MPLVLTDQLEDLSRAMVQAVSAVAGVCYTEPRKDRISRDILFEDIDHGRLTDFPIIGAQLKATTQIELLPSDSDFLFPLPLKNYNDLRVTAQVPVILIVALLPKRPAEWMAMTQEQMVLRRCLYWRSLAGEPDTANTTSVSVRIPINQVFDPATLVAMMNRVREGGSL